LQTKDYYKILELSPSASLRDIKSAYRRLAHRFHPDKNNADPYSTAHFEIIKEAYEVLSDPRKKEYYLQHRWYDQVINRKQSSTTITPVNVLKQVLELDKYVSKLDVHRMDKQGFYEYACRLLNDETIQKLNAFDEKDINKAIVDSLLKSSHALPLKFARPLSLQLLKLNTNASTLEKIRLYVNHSRRSETWSKFKVWLLLLIAVFLCWLIYSLSR
jgi:curved DNA-binding protein CbpA